MSLLESPNTPTAPPPAIPKADKREAIERELQNNPGRADREIARIVGCDHKTVGAARERLGIASPVGNPASSPDKVVSLLATTLAKNGLDPTDPELFPILTAAANRKEKEFNPFDPKDDCLVAPERLGLACFVNTRNNVVIANGNERDGIDEMVQVAPSDLPALIARLGEIASEFRDGEYGGEGGA